MRLLKFRWVTTAASSRCTILSILCCVYFISLTPVVNSASSSSKTKKTSSGLTRNTRTSEFVPSKAFNPIQAAEVRKSQRQSKRLLLPYVKENITKTSSSSKNKPHSSQETDNSWKTSRSDEWNNVASVKNLQDKLKNTKTVRINDTRYFTPLKKGNSNNTTKKPRSSSSSKKTFSIAKNLTSYASPKETKTFPPKVEIKPTHVTHFTYADIRPSAGDFIRTENDDNDKTSSYSQSNPVYTKPSSSETKTSSSSNYFIPNSVESKQSSSNFFSPGSAETKKHNSNFFSPSPAEGQMSGSNSFSPSPAEPLIFSNAATSHFQHSYSSVPAPSVPVPTHYQNSYSSVPVPSVPVPTHYQNSYSSAPVTSAPVTSTPAPSVPVPSVSLSYGFTPVPKTSSNVFSSSSYSSPKISSSSSYSSPQVSSSASDESPHVYSIASANANFADAPHVYSSASSSSSNSYAPVPLPTPLSSNNNTWGIPSGTPTYVVPILPTVRKVDNSIHYRHPPPLHRPLYPPHHRIPFRPPPHYPIRPHFFRPPSFKLSGLSAKLNNMFDEGSPRGISSLAKPGIKHKPYFGSRPFVQDPIPLDTNEKLSSHSASFESYNNPGNNVLIIGHNDDHGSGPTGVTRIKGNKKAHYTKGSTKHSSQEIVHHSHENQHHSHEHSHHSSHESHKHKYREKEHEKQSSYERIYGQTKVPKHAYVPAAGLSPGVDPGLHFTAPLGPLSPKPIFNSKKKSIPDLVPLDKRVVYLSMVASWVFWIITFCTYYHWGQKFGHPVPGKPGYYFNKPIIFTVPEDGSTPHFTKRSLEGTLAGGRWNFARVLELIEIAQKTYEGFDWQSMDCQKKVLCELSHKNNDLGETGRKISTSISYYTGVSDKYMEALEGFPMPSVIQYYLKEYKDAVTQGKNSNKECGQIYSTCKFSLKDIFVNKSIKKSA